MRFALSAITYIFLTSITIAQSFGSNAPQNKVAESLEAPMEVEAVADGLEDLVFERVIDPNEYMLGPGDEIGLNIQTALNQTFLISITPTGDLLIPGVGVCHVSGLSLTEGMEVVKRYVLGQAYPSARVSMVLVKPRHFLLQVTGAVQQPGFATVTPTSRLSDVIEGVGQFHQLAKEFEIEITRAQGEVEIIDFHKYILFGELTSNPTFYEGDRIKVPFGQVDKSGIVVRGSIMGAGYDIISENETLGSYLRRKVVYGESADVRNITLTRMVDGKTQHLVISPKHFDETILLAQDEINILWERGVMVNGFVKVPGGFSFYPGYSVADYISLAGGNLEFGDPRRVTVTHLDGDTERGNDVIVKRGDVIYVPRNRKDILIGNSSILGVFTALSTLYLTYLATAGR